MNLRSFLLTSGLLPSSFAAMVALVACCGGGSHGNNRYPDASLTFDALPDRRPDTAPRPAPAVGA